MNIAIKLTDEQYLQVKGQPFAKNCYFNPVKDAYDNWVISFEELIAIEDKQFAWLWDCPQIEFIAPYEAYDFFT